MVQLKKEYGASARRDKPAIPSKPALYKTCPEIGSAGASRQCPVDLDRPSLGSARLVAFGIHPAPAAATFAELPVLLAHETVNRGGSIHKHDLIAENLSHRNWQATQMSMPTTFCQAIPILL